MKISYISNLRMPTEKAHGIQIAKLCDALSKGGHTVSLILPKISNHITKDIFDYYSIRRSTNVIYRRIPRLPFRLRSLAFVLSLLFVDIDKDSHIITRDVEIAWIYAIRGYKVYYYAHNWPSNKNRIFVWMLSGVFGIICNSEGTAKRFRDSGFTNICVIPNGVDLQAFSFGEDKYACREKVGLPRQNFIIMYVGHLYEWKGVNILLEAASLMGDKSRYLFFFVGGTDMDIERYKDLIEEKNIKNVVLCGHKEPSIIPYYVRSADVLVLPNIPTTQESMHFTSPIKLFEYLASGVPVIASDMPSIREIASDQEVFFVEPANPQKIVSAIKEIEESPDIAQNKAQKGKSQASMYSWDSRADSIIKYFS